MYNVQIVLAHNKQTYFQPKFPKKNINNKKILQQTKIEKKNLPKNFDLDNSSHTSKKLREEVPIWNRKNRNYNFKQGVAKRAISQHNKKLTWVSKKSNSIEQRATEGAAVSSVLSKEQQEEHER